MSPHSAMHDVEGFDATLAFDQAWTPPSNWYTDARVFELERRHVFGASWHFAARLAQLERPGAFVAGSIAGEPYVVLRDESGTLRALSNVCRHHGAEICHGEGALEKLVCPYHGWTYDLGGRLARAPELGAAREFDRASFSLPSFDIATFGPWVFVSLARAARSLEQDTAELRARLEPTRYEELTFVARRQWEFACNWKVYVDNYLDGGYHIARLHPGLASELDLAGYRTEVFERSSLQTSPGTGRANPGRVGDAALYAWLHPNFMVNRYGDVMDTNLVIPLSLERTLVVMDFYFVDAERAAASGFVERCLASSDAVQREDIAISESVQRGLGSRSYVRGRYSVAREAAMHRFHVLLARDLASASA